MENDLAYLDGLVSRVLLAVYPIGSIYCSLSDADPATLFGGAWEKVSSGRVLQGADSTHAAGSTAEAGLPNIEGKIRVLNEYDYNNASITGVINGAFTPTYPAVDTGQVHQAAASSSSRTGNDGIWNVGFSAKTSNAIYGASTTVQPPAYFVNIWKRTA